MHAELITQHFMYKAHWCYSAFYWQGHNYEYRLLRQRTANV